jgi:hypothetical protein
VDHNLDTGQDSNQYIVGSPGPSLAFSQATNRTQRIVVYQKIHTSVGVSHYRNAIEYLEADQFQDDAKALQVVVGVD